MNNRQAREFRERWQAVADIERVERTGTSIALRWQQTNSIFRLAMGLGLPISKENDAETEAVLRRWALLKEAAT